MIALDPLLPECHRTSNNSNPSTSDVTSDRLELVIVVGLVCGGSGVWWVLVVVIMVIEIIIVLILVVMKKQGRTMYCSS